MPNTGEIASCRWQWCRQAFASNSELVQHVLHEHIANTQPVSITVDAFSPVSNATANPHLLTNRSPDAQPEPAPTRLPSPPDPQYHRPQFTTITAQSSPTPSPSPLPVSPALSDRIRRPLRSPSPLKQQRQHAPSPSESAMDVEEQLTQGLVLSPDSSQELSYPSVAPSITIQSSQDGGRSGDAHALRTQAPYQSPGHTQSSTELVPSNGFPTERRSSSGTFRSGSIRIPPARASTSRPVFSDPANENGTLNSQLPYNPPSPLHSQAHAQSHPFSLSEFDDLYELIPRRSQSPFNLQTQAPYSFTQSLGSFPGY